MLSRKCILRASSNGTISLWARLPTGQDTLTPRTSSPRLPVQAVLQPGSKAGFYTQKSPKMLLLEWTQQQKRLKPRYKTLRTEEGSFRCKVCAQRMSEKTRMSETPDRSQYTKLA